MTNGIIHLLGPGFPLSIWKEANWFHMTVSVRLHEKSFSHGRKEVSRTSSEKILQNSHIFSLVDFWVQCRLVGTPPSVSIHVVDEKVSSSPVVDFTQ